MLGMLVCFMAMLLSAVLLHEAQCLRARVGYTAVDQSIHCTGTQNLANWGNGSDTAR